MASSNVRKPCSKCMKGSGVAICDGCQQSFCIKHFTDHRQELSHQLEIIGLEHDMFRKDLDQYDSEPTLLNRIDTWEQESIAKIQTVAETARTNMRELLDEHKEEMKTSVRKITDELQSCRESYDYTENDIEKWSQQLQNLRRILECPPPIEITEEGSLKSIIRLIQVHKQKTPFSPTVVKQPLRRLFSTINNAAATTNEQLNRSLPNEIFDEIDGKAKTSEDNLVVTCYSKTFLFPSIVYGGKRYSTGIHRICLRIEYIGNSIFFGISTSSEHANRADVFDESLFGWWDVVRPVLAGQLQKSDDNKIVRAGDELTLILDCDNQQIQLHHHRTNQLVQQLIDITKCPFPWKIVIKLRAEGDSIRILQ
ncbi:hypothetical protein I4U23_002708 [Adineta vaga]|nr:hypothetical protein I4U23_002708 [Adineta vaga]